MFYNVNAYKSVWMEQKEMSYYIHKTLYNLQEKYDPNYKSLFLNAKSIEIFDLERDIWEFECEWDRFMEPNVTYSDYRFWTYGGEGARCKYYILNFAERLSELRKSLFSFTTNIDGVVYRGKLRIRRVYPHI